MHAHCCPGRAGAPATQPVLAALPKVVDGVAPGLLAAPSSVPALRVADVLRQHGPAFVAGHALTPAQARVLRDISRCRTEVLGGHLEYCPNCGFERPRYNGCCNRHCPSCQTLLQERWIEQRKEAILPVGHFHVVFTLPEELRPLAMRNNRIFYDLLFDAGADTLHTLAREKMGAVLGFTGALHTWTREMLPHPHGHWVVTAGGLAADGKSWVATRPGFLFPAAQMRAIFRSRVLAALERYAAEGTMDLGGDLACLAEPRHWRRLMRRLARKKWVVYAKRPFANAGHVFEYLGRYTHHVAISDSRMVAVDDSSVTFRTKNGGQVTIPPLEFVRRFLLHVLPDGLHKIRHYGLYAAASHKTTYARALALLPKPPEEEQTARDTDPDADTNTGDRNEDHGRLCPQCSAAPLEFWPLPKPPRKAAAPRPLPASAPCPRPEDSS